MDNVLEMINLMIGFLGFGCLIGIANDDKISTKVCLTIVVAMLIFLVLVINGFIL